MNRKLVALAGAALTSATVVVAMAMPATAGPSSVAAPVPAVDPDGASPDLVSAIQRDFNLTADQARARIANEAKASRTELSLRKRLGAAFGGAYLNADASTF